MIFSKSTKSYELITILEKGIMNNRIKSILLFMIKYELFNINTKIKLRKKSNKEKIDLFIDLFKEYFYLDKIVNDLNIYRYSIFNYVIISDIIIASIMIDDLTIKVEYNIYTKEYCIYIDTSNIKMNTRGINITERILDNKEINELFNNISNILFNDILYIMIRVFNHYNKLNKK